MGMTSAQSPVWLTCLHCSLSSGMAAVLSAADQMLTSIHTAARSTRRELRRWWAANLPFARGVLCCSGCPKGVAVDAASGDEGGELGGDKDVVEPLPHPVCLEGAGTGGGVEHAQPVDHTTVGPRRSCKVGCVSRVLAVGPLFRSPTTAMNRPLRSGAPRASAHLGEEKVEARDLPPAP